MATEEELKEIIELVKISHAWMLEKIEMRADAFGISGDYSDELKHAIEVQELLKLV